MENDEVQPHIVVGGDKKEDLKDKVDRMLEEDYKAWQKSADRYRNQIDIKPLMCMTVDPAQNHEDIVRATGLPTGTVMEDSDGKPVTLFIADEANGVDLTAFEFAVNRLRIEILPLPLNQQPLEFKLKDIIQARKDKVGFFEKVVEENLRERMKKYDDKLIIDTIKIQQDIEKTMGIEEGDIEQAYIPIQSYTNVSPPTVEQILKSFDELTQRMEVYKKTVKECEEKIQAELVRWMNKRKLTTEQAAIELGCDREALYTFVFCNGRMYQELQDALKRYAFAHMTPQAAMSLQFKHTEETLP